MSHKGFNFNIIRESETYFKVEKIPRDLTFFERLSFYSTLRDSIDGLVLKVYEASDCIVYIYTKKQDIKYAPCTLLIEKVCFLFKLINEPVSSEVWIVKEDCNYSCIGIFKNIPVFFKSFHSVSDIKQNLKEMRDQMNNYLELSCIRIFGFDQFEVVIDEADVFEYSLDFMRHRLNKQTNLNDYCIEAYLEKTLKSRLNMYLLVFNICLIVLSVALFTFNKGLKNCIRELETDLIRVD